MISELTDWSSEAVDGVETGPVEPL